MSDRLFILNFHGLGEPPSGVVSEELPFWITPAFFEAILDLVRARDDVLITFDDSNGSDYELALPALEARGLRAKFFVLADYLNRKGYLSEEQVLALAEAGMTIGNHGLCHLPWTCLSPVKLEKELKEAKRRLEKISGRTVDEAACPFGMYNRRVLGALKDSGYARVYTTDERPAQASAWLQARYSILRMHTLAQVVAMVSQVPRGAGHLWRCLKTQLRRVR